MINLKLTDSSQVVHKLQFPQGLSEVTLNNKVAFDVLREDISIWIADQSDQGTLQENQSYYLYLVAKAVSEFTNWDLQILLAQDTPEYTEELDNYDLENLEINLLMIYRAVINLVDSYDFEFRDSDNYTFTYKGIDWEIPYVVKSIFNNKKVFSKFSVQQSVEMLQIKKGLQDKIESKRKSVSTDDVKNIRFTSFLKMIALTVNKVGESFPLDDVPFKRLIEERMVFFQDIDMKTAYDITFFLTNITLSSKKILTTNITSTVQSLKSMTRLKKKTVKLGSE